MALRVRTQVHPTGFFCTINKIISIFLELCSKAEKWPFQAQNYIGKNGPLGCPHLFCAASTDHTLTQNPINIQWKEFRGAFFLEALTR